MRARLGLIVLFSGAAAIASACGDSNVDINDPTNDAGVGDATAPSLIDSSIVTTSNDGATGASPDDDDDAGDAATEAGDDDAGDDDAGDDDAGDDDAGDAGDAGDAATTHPDAGKDAGDGGDASTGCTTDDDCNGDGQRCSFLIADGCSAVGQCLTPPSSSCGTIFIEHACSCTGTTLTWTGGCKPQYTNGYAPAPARSTGSCSDAGL